jgi:uncharacterized glyoxalase superfamily protein PhnB
MSGAHNSFKPKPLRGSVIQELARNMKTYCAATVFSVKSLKESLKFYTDILGFTEDFRFEEYAGVKHEEVFIHLSQNYPHWRPPGSGAIYIYCDDVDDFYAQIKAKGCETQNEPQDRPYEMRDFTAFDVDGNQITFGHETSQS